MSDHGRGNEITDIIRFPDPLKRDADDAAVLNDRSAAVARVNRGVGLYDEVPAIGAVGVGVRLDARDDALRDGDPVPADGKAVRGDGAVDFWDVGQFEGIGVVEEARVIDGEQGTPQRGAYPR